MTPSELRKAKARVCKAATAPEDTSMQWQADEKSHVYLRYVVLSQQAWS